MTFQEYMAQKKLTGMKKEARKPEEVKKKDIEKVEAPKGKATTITSNLKNQETYAISQAHDENAALLGFQGEEEFFHRGGRGGRGGHRGAR
jgi:hypothetical protein